MIRDRLQTSLLDEAQDIIAHLTVENKQLSRTVSSLEEALEAVTARLKQAEHDGLAHAPSTALSSEPTSSHPAHQVLLLQQQLVEKESRLQVMEAQQRQLVVSVATLEAMLQQRRRTQAEDGTAAPQPTPTAPLAAHTLSQTPPVDEAARTLALQVRRLQQEARHARESERNYARMVDALQQELLFTQRQLIKWRGEHRQPLSSSPSSAPQPRAPAPAVPPMMAQACTANAASLAALEQTVASLSEDCAAVIHWDAEIITHLRAELEDRNRQLAQLSHHF